MCKTTLNPLSAWYLRRPRKVKSWPRHWCLSWQWSTSSAQTLSLEQWEMVPLSMELPYVTWVSFIQSSCILCVSLTRLTMLKSFWNLSSWFIFSDWNVFSWLQCTPSIERENWIVHSNLEWNTLVEQVKGTQPSANLFWFRLAHSSAEWKKLPSQSWASAWDSRQSYEISRFTLGARRAYWCWGAFCHLLLRRR